MMDSTFTDNIYLDAPECNDQPSIFLGSTSRRHGRMGVEEAPSPSAGD